MAQREPEQRAPTCACLSHWLVRRSKMAARTTCVLFSLLCSRSSTWGHVNVDISNKHNQMELLHNRRECQAC